METHSLNVKKGVSNVLIAGESYFDEKNVEEVFNLCSTEQSCINIGITCYKIGTLTISELYENYNLEKIPLIVWVKTRRISSHSLQEGAPYLALANLLVGLQWRLTDDCCKILLIVLSEKFDT